jgi:hypothetical protein
MRGAGFAQVDQPTMPHLAMAYDSATPPEPKMSPVPPFLAASGNAAGTVDDAVRAAHSVFHTKFLKPSSRRELTQVLWPEQQYALGGRVRIVGREPWAWETGTVGGYRAHIAHRLRQSETIVILNTTDLAQARIGQWVETIAAG